MAKGSATPWARLWYASAIAMVASLMARFASGTPIGIPDYVSEGTVQVQDANVHYYSVGDITKAPCILFLHGAAFSADTWLDIGTLQHLKQNKIAALAVDLPGYGKSTGNPRDKILHSEFIITLIQVLKMEPPIVVSPSMSGSYSLPFIAKYPTQAAGYVPVAPVGVAMYQSMLEGSQVPTMVLWGELDNPRRADSLAHLFKEADVVIFKDGRHPCYMDDPELFNSLLVKFVMKLRNLQLAKMGAPRSM
eukprot:jgi/Mesvir1/26775/Mv20548-RA.1